MSIYSLKNILLQSMPILFIVAVIGLFSGFVLHGNEGLLLTLPGILVIIPSFINISGSIASVLSSRISSALHLGLIHPKLHRIKTLDDNILASWVVAIISFTSLGFIVLIFNMVFGIPGLGIILPLVTLAAGFLTVLVLSFLSVVLSYLSFRKGVDPDNWVIPLLTTLGDFIGILALFSVMGLVIY